MLPLWFVYLILIMLLLLQYTTVTYTLNKDGSVSTAGEATDNYTCQGNQTQTGTSIGGVAMTTGWKKGDTISYTYDNATGKVTITVG